MVNLITEHLEIWTSAREPKKNGGRGRGKKANGQSPHGIKKLCELILELAVRGKLVPQDPNDEPASLLLEKITQEKARLIKEGKIKKQKTLPEISEEEKPFELPEGWSWARLGDVASYIQRGKGPRYVDMGCVRVVSQKCVQWSGFDLLQARFVDDESLGAYQPERFLQKNDLLWNSTGTGTVGRINVLGELKANELVADSHVTVIRSLKVNSDFLWCYVAAPGIQLRIEPEHEESLVSGTTKQVELNTGVVIPLVVPIPPLPEQRRIVAKVDELMALCDQLEQQQTDSNATHQTLLEILLTTLTKAADHDEFTQVWQRIANHFDTLFTTAPSIDQLKQTILQLAVMGKLVPQNPTDEPASVLLEKIAKEKARLIKEGKLKKQKKLPEISEEEKQFELPDGWEWVRLAVITSKITDGDHKTPPRIPEGYRLLSAKNVRNGYLDYDNCDFISEQHYLKSRERCLPEPGDLLIVSVGGTIGRISLVPDDSHFSLVRSVALVKPLLFSSSYLKHAMNSELLQSSIHSRKRGGAQPCLYLSEIAQFMFSLPPLAEQHRIVAKVNELMAICDQLQAKLTIQCTTTCHFADTMTEQVVSQKAVQC